ncbi:MAG: 4-(cytidine 5'-diphospho)-2-C-methyl-D-erythritol kinase [Steroidobacteraceae bacterium]|nr:4-(cytidine 5'-diphospho)-2-C-methyl-D-erythritol kinase [Steroidobacteraceae bacterium]
MAVRAVNPAPWPAPAKLNLFLHVLGRRADGYHDIQTAFQLIDLADSLVIRPRADGAIVRPGGPPAVPEQTDLCIRAARRLQAEHPAGPGAEIRLAKRIPIMGGLGGGSSDAATTLVALNEIWGLRLPVDRLAAIGRELGADVPLFVHGHSAWAEGTGERLTPLALPAMHFALVYPGAGVPTAEVFQAPELTRNSARTTIRGFLKAGGRNDCEAVVAARHPAVAAALTWLRQRGDARLTGTGSCVFAPFADERSAHAALEGLPPGWTGLVARGLDRSPLQERLAAERSGGCGPE